MPAIDNAAAMQVARRFALLHVFVKAGRAIVSRLVSGRKGKPATHASKPAPSSQASKLPAPCRRVETPQRPKGNVQRKDEGPKPS
jgi:hypothetical protein